MILRSVKTDKSKFKFLLKKALKNNFLNVWNEIRNTYLLNKGKLNTYFKYKTSFNLENYLFVKNLKNRHILTKFRLSNHTLRIETGRHERKLNSVSGKLELLPSTVLVILLRTNCILLWNVLYIKGKEKPF